MPGPGKKKTYTTADCIGANCTKPKGMRGGPSRSMLSHRKKTYKKDTDVYVPETTGGLVKQRDENTTNLEVVKHGEGYSQKLYSGTKTAEAVKKYSVADKDVPLSKKKTVEVEEDEETSPKTYSVKTMKKSDLVISPKKKLVRK